MIRKVSLFILCASYTIIGVIGVATGEGTSFKDAPVPVWACWGVVVTGLFLCCVCIYEFNKKKPSKRPDTVIDAEYAEAQKAADAWYQREFGKMPDYDEAKKSTDEWYYRTFGRMPDPEPEKEKREE